MTDLVLDNGHQVGVTIGGEGTPLVFLHGATANRKVYTELLAPLAAHYRVVALDAAGHGGTDPLPFGHSFEEMIDVLAESLQQLGISRAIMVGHSMGGRMALEFSARYPERVIAAVLIDAAAGDEFDSVTRLTPKWVLRSPARLMGVLVDSWGEAFRAGPRRLVSILGRQLAHPARGLLGVAWAFKGASTVESLAVLREAGVPTVVIHGERDRIIPLKSAHNAAEIAGAELVIVSGGYHSWILSNPGLGAGVLIDALSRVSSLP